MYIYELKADFTADPPHPARKGWHIGFFKTAKRAGERANELIKQHANGPGEMTAFGVTEYVLED